MNKGITILAEEVRLVDKDKRLYEVIVDDELGIVDGAHTVKLIEEAQDEGRIPPEQHVEVYIKTGIESSFVSDIAKGLNTGMQVKAQSIFNIDGVFDWLKDEIKDMPYAKLISWKESDSGEYDVRDIISVLECFNVTDFPNESGKHPISAYEKWSVPLEKFGKDFKDNFRGGTGQSKYLKLRPLLREALYLHDLIRHDFRVVHNSQGGAAGKMKIVEEASQRKGTFAFPFAPSLSHERYRLTKGALYPILAAFRNCVSSNKRTGNAEWIRGFDGVLELWDEAGPELVHETYLATREIGPNPDQIGKSRNHWANLYKTLELRMLRRAVREDRRG